MIEDGQRSVDSLLMTVDEVQVDFSRLRAALTTDRRAVWPITHSCLSLIPLYTGLTPLISQRISSTVA